MHLMFMDGLWPASAKCENIDEINEVALIVVVNMMLIDVESATSME